MPFLTEDRQWNLGNNGGSGPVGGPVEMVATARRLLDKIASWPYPWSYPPAGSSPVFAQNTIALPLIGTTGTEICEFICPIGYRGYIKSVMVTLQDSNYVDGQGMASWTIDINQTAGSTFAIGRPAPYFGNILTQMGSTLQGPVELPFGFLLFGNDIIRVKINIPTLTFAGIGNPLTPGFPQSTTAWLMGWTYPEPDIE